MANELSRTPRPHDVITSAPGARLDAMPPSSRTARPSQTLGALPARLLEARLIERGPTMMLASGEGGRAIRFVKDPLDATPHSVVVAALPVADKAGRIAVRLGEARPLGQQLQPATGELLQGRVAAQRLEQLDLDGLVRELAPRLGETLVRFERRLRAGDTVRAVWLLAGLGDGLPRAGDACLAGVAATFRRFGVCPFGSSDSPDAWSCALALAAPATRAIVLDGALGLLTPRQAAALDGEIGDPTRPFFAVGVRIALEHLGLSTAVRH